MLCGLEKHLRCAPFGWCSERRVRSWSEGGACDVQTRAARFVRCGEHAESSSRMVHPLYEPDAPSRGTDARMGGPALGPADRSLLSSAYCGTDAGVF
jgi:hypothetical protein